MKLVSLYVGSAQDISWRGETVSTATVVAEEMRKIGARRKVAASHQAAS